MLYQPGKPIIFLQKGILYTGMIEKMDAELYEVKLSNGHCISVADEEIVKVINQSTIESIKEQFSLAL